MTVILNGKEIKTYTDLAYAALEELQANLDKIDAENYHAWFEVRGAMNALADLYKQAGEQYDCGITLIDADELTSEKRAQMKAFDERMGKLMVDIEAKMKIVYDRL